MQTNEPQSERKAAYCQMVGELFPYFLHDLNNPLTALQAYGYSFSSISQPENKASQQSYLTEIDKISAKLMRTSDLGGKLIQALNENYSPKLNAEIEALIKLMQIKFRRVQASLESGTQLFPMEKLMPNRDVLLLIYTILEIIYFQIFKMNDEPGQSLKSTKIKLRRSVNPVKLYFDFSTQYLPENLRPASDGQPPVELFHSTYLPASSQIFLQVSRKFCQTASITFELSGDSNKTTVALVF